MELVKDRTCEIKIDHGKDRTRARSSTNVGKIERAKYLTCERLNTSKIFDERAKNRNVWKIERQKRRSRALGQKVRLTNRQTTTQTWKQTNTRDPHSLCYCDTHHPNTYCSNTGCVPILLNINTRTTTVYITDVKLQLPPDNLVYLLLYVPLGAASQAPLSLCGQPLYMASCSTY